MKKLFFNRILFTFALSIFCFVSVMDADSAQESLLGSARVVFQTNYGDIEFGFYPSVAPQTVEHIYKLVRLGCYNTNHFFRVDKGFVAQVADVVGGRTAPMNAEQRKEAEKTIIGEFSDVKHVRGILSMGRSSGNRDPKLFAKIASRPEKAGYESRFLKKRTNIELVKYNLDFVDDFFKAIKWQFDTRDAIDKNVMPVVVWYADPNSAQSSFSMLLGDAPHLDHEYAIFGKVTKGDETLKKLEELPTRREGIFVMPTERITILSTYYYDIEMETCQRDKSMLKRRLAASAVEIERQRMKCFP